MCRESDSKEKDRIMARALMDKGKRMSEFFQKLIEVLKEFNLSTLACTLEKKLNQ